MKGKSMKFHGKQESQLDAPLSQVSTTEDSKSGES